MTVSLEDCDDESLEELERIASANGWVSVLNDVRNLQQTRVMENDAGGE